VIFLVGSKFKCATALLPPIREVLGSDIFPKIRCPVISVFLEASPRIVRHPTPFARGQ
jgi:hypothetical protein